MGYSQKVIEWLHPYRQMMIMLGLMLVWMLGIVMFKTVLQIENYPSLIWECMLTVVLFYILINNLLSLKNFRVPKYWQNSIISFILLCLIGNGLAFGLSGKHILSMGSMAWLLGLFVFVYFLLLSIARAMRSILEYVMKQDSKLRGEE